MTAIPADPDPRTYGTQPTITGEVLEARFTYHYHPPKADQPERYEQIRSKAKQLASLIVEATPVSREQSLALTHLEEAVMWANAAIARNE